jgi:excisionase family DNA binding protein
MANMSTFQPSKQFLFVGEVSRATGLHENTVRKLIRQGDLRSLLLGRRYLIPKSELNRLDALARTGKSGDGSNPMS